MKLSVVIPSLNGLELLRRFLPGIKAETDRAGGELIVVDDCSTDGSSALIPVEFPGVRVISRSGEPGFCHAVNLGMAKARGNMLLLLNNDTVPLRDSFSLLVKALEKSDDAAAAAVPSIPRPDGTDDSLFRWWFRRGLAVTGQGDSGETYPSGACSLWKRSAWEYLGGLDTRYAPIYWEDTDMGARMTKAGMKLLLVSEAVVNHMHGSTMGASAGTMALRERNRFIFMDAHCSSPASRISTLLWLPLHLALGGRAFRRGFADYLKWKRGQREA